MVFLILKSIFLNCGVIVGLFIIGVFVIVVVFVGGEKNFGLMSRESFYFFVDGCMEVFCVLLYFN